MLTIPCRPDQTDYAFQVALDGATFTLRFRWNTRELAWYMDVGDETDAPIYTSVKIVVNFPLGFRSRDPRRPLGFFLAGDTTKKGRDPGIADLGDRVQLYYFEKGTDTA